MNNNSIVPLANTRKRFKEAQDNFNDFILSISNNRPSLRHLNAFLFSARSVGFVMEKEASVSVARKNTLKNPDFKTRWKLFTDLRNESENEGTVKTIIAQSFVSINL